MTNSSANFSNPVIQRSVTIAFFWSTTAILLILCTVNNICSAVGLSLNEQQQAAKLAAKVPWIATDLVAPHPLGLQTLSIEKQEQKNSQGSRVVRIYQYHHNHEQSRLLVLDLQEQVLVREQFINTAHLPLNQVEIDYAIAIVAKDTKLLEQLRAEQQHRQRSPFSSVSELDIKASIFEPSDLQHPCAVQRCALLSFFDDSNTVFSIEPIVYLRTAQIELLSRP